MVYLVQSPTGPSLCFCVNGASQKRKKVSSTYKTLRFCPEQSKPTFSVVLPGALTGNTTIPKLNQCFTQSERERERERNGGRSIREIRGSVFEEERV